MGSRDGGRLLTASERAQVSAGLRQALQDAGAQPRIRPNAHPASYLAALRFGSAPIMAVGSTIWWPDAPPDLSGTRQMATLQHELQHVLEFAEGKLSILGYLLWPPNWRYDLVLSPGLRWAQLGAEQRATAAEALWRSEQAGDEPRTRLLRALIPWADDDV